MESQHRQLEAIEVIGIRDFLPSQQNRSRSLAYTVSNVLGMSVWDQAEAKTSAVCKQRVFECAPPIMTSYSWLQYSKTNMTIWYPDRNHRWNSIKQGMISVKLLLYLTVMRVAIGIFTLPRHLKRYDVQLLHKRNPICFVTNSLDLKPMRVTFSCRFLSPLTAMCPI